MCVGKKHIHVLLSKPLKWFCVLLILLISAFSFAYNHPSAIAPLIKVIHPKTELPPHTQLVSGLIKKYTAASLQLVNPPDITMNVCGTSATLTPANIPTGYSNLTWNNGSTGPTLTVNTSGTYWWQVTGTNVVTNGNFSSTSPTGFTSDYTNVTTNTPNGTQLVPEGAYAIGTNPKAYHSAFTSFGDHTTGSGNMLIVNGASVANQKVWAENITVTANTNYVFSVWATSASPSNPAVLQFSINNTSLGTLSLSSTLADGVWQYFTATWNSGTLSGTVPISLVNQNIVANGNDFAIDDIVFAPVYRQNIVVNLNPIPVLSLSSPHTACGSYDLTQTISGYDPNTYTYTFTNPSGTIITTANAQAVTQSGTYTITETNISTGCTSAPQQTAVTINPIPVLSLSGPHTACGSYDLTQTISGYDPTTYTYTFTNPSGTIITTAAAQAVTQSGAYTVTETNKTTGCTSAPQQTTVTINPIPVLSLSSPHTACGSYDLTQTISGYDPTTYTYTFTNPSGTIITIAAAQAVTQSGAYTVTETNKTTTCTSAPQQTAVTINPIPVLSLSSPHTTCGSYDLTQTINGYDPITYTYTFQGPSPSTNTITTTNAQAITLSGAYTITETNKTTGCTSAPQQTTVTINPIPPQPGITAR